MPLASVAFAPASAVRNVETWVALVLTITGTIGGTATGAIIALRGARSLSRDERIAAERAENLRAFRVFVAEAVQAISELKQLPPVPKPWPTDRLLELVERPLRGGKAGMQMATRSRIYKRYGDRHLNLAGRLGAALVDLMMRDLPPNVEAAVQRAADYVKRLGEQRTPELIAEWGAVHADLVAAGHELRALATDSSHTASHTLPTNAVERRVVKVEADG
jgi:hypothetical protein